MEKIIDNLLWYFHNTINGFRSEALKTYGPSGSYSINNIMYRFKFTVLEIIYAVLLGVIMVVMSPILIFYGFKIALYENMTPRDNSHPGK